MPSFQVPFSISHNVSRHRRKRKKSGLSAGGKVVRSVKLVYGCDQMIQKLSTEKFLYTCNKLGYEYFRLMPNNNNLVNRPFADLQERLDNVQRQERNDVNTIDRRDMYRAIATYLDSEIYHLIVNTDNAEIKQWGRRILNKVAEMHKDIL